MGWRLSVLAVLTLLAVVEMEPTHRAKVFLTEGEFYLFFPHRHFQTITTYTSNCSARPKELATSHPAMATVASFPFNNNNIAISIFSLNEASSTVFHYAKINPNGICTVYEVQEEEIDIIFQYNFGEEFSKVILVDRLSAFLWNTHDFATLEYSLLNRKVTVRRGQLGSEDAWSCQKYKEGMICWGSYQILIIFPSFQSISYSWQGEMIRMILPLDLNQDVFFICSLRQCNITLLAGDGSLENIDNYPFVEQILGGDFNPQTNQFVVIHPSTATIFNYNSRQLNAKIEQSVNYFSDLECVFIENVRFLNDHILVNCNNFMGEAEHLALIRDRETNRYYAYQPLQQQATSPCLFDGNQKYIFALCKTYIATMTNNFAYFQIPYAPSPNKISIDCQSATLKMTEGFQLSILPAELGEAYVNQPLEEWTMNSEDTITLKLRETFTASAIDYYTIDSANCPYLPNISYPNVEAVTYLSLYVKEHCVQVLAADTRTFYRVLQINDTLFYIQFCTLVKVGFGCQLIDIVEGISNLHLLYYDSLLFRLYLHGGDLVVDGMDEAEVVFREVLEFDVRDEVVRVRSRSNKIFSNSVGNVINNSGRWIEEMEHLRFSLPYVLNKGYYMFVINQTHISKLYHRETTIVVYELSYNTRCAEVESIRSVDNYIVVQYQIGYFEIYDTQREAVAALMAVEQEEILCDIVLMDRDVILVPLKGQNYLLRIQTEPTLLLGQLPPFYDRFHERCIFSLRPHLSNGSCPRSSESVVEQQFIINIQFNIQKIDLLSHTLVVHQPYQCDNCLFEIEQTLFRGPIFTYEFNDDDSGTFRLVAHLNAEDCEEEEETHLLRMVEVPTADENTRIQLLMVNATHLLLVDKDLREIYDASHPFASSCLAYTQLDSQYLLLCHKEFLLFSKGSPLTSIPHSLHIQGDHHYQLKSESARDGIHYIYLRQGLTMHILLLCLNSSSMEYVSVQTLTPAVWDFIVVRQSIITLEHKQICIAAYPSSPSSPQPVHSCFQLNTIIPERLAHDYDYQQFLPYYSTETCIRALLISGTSANLHVDIEIDLSQSPVKFTLLNVYAGYLGFELMGIVSINVEEGSYSNFILHYQDTKDSAPTSTGSLVAYYQYNPKFATHGEIGQIRSAIFLANYFQNGPRFSFLSFPHRLYITNFTQLTLGERLERRFKKCVSVRVEDRLQVVSSYKQPSLLQFLILKTKNINDLQTFYIKFSYSQQPGLLLHSSISLAATALFFVLLAVATNKCKETSSSELTIHFMSEEVEREFSEGDGQSDLLHSNTSQDPSSANSPRSMSPAHSFEDLDID